MKKLLSVILCVMLILTLVSPGAMAENKSVSINSVVPNYNTGTVSISGVLSGYYYSPWRKAVTVGITVLDASATSEGAEEDNSKIYHIDEIAVDKYTGEFTYTFEHKNKAASDNCRIVLHCEGYISAQESYSFYSGDAQNEILSARNAACVNSPLYFAQAQRIEAELTPYKEEGEIYLPLEMAAALVNAQFDKENSQFSYENKSYTGEYVKASELSLNVSYNEGLVYTGSPLTASEISAVVPAFGIHVSKSGSDSADGSAVAPVETIARALEIYKVSGAYGYIFVHSGIYNEETVIGSEYSDLKIKAVGDVALMPVSREISKTSFRRVTDIKVLEMIPEEARGEVLVAKLPGCTDTSTTLYKVFAGSEEQPIARFPNGGGFTMASGVTEAQEGENFETLFYPDTKKLEAWQKDSNARILLFRSSGYQVSRGKIIATQPRKGSAHITWGSTKPAQTPGKRFFVYDTLCELDMAGEWYIDRTKELIYYYPQDDFNGITVTSGVNPVITINNAKNITIDGFEIRGARKIGVKLSESDGINFKNCVVRSTGTVGIETAKITNSTIEGCVVKDTGEAGIRLNYSDTDGGIDPSLTPQNNIVRNNNIYNVGNMSPIAGAVYMGSTKNTFSHNTVHDFPHMGIWYRGNDNVIEYNDFYNGLKYCDDAGIIYGNPGIRGFGNVIQYNRVRNYKSYNPYEGEIYMIYLDADTSGTLIKGNIIDLSEYSSGFATAGLSGGGRNNIVEENILIGGAQSGTMGFYMSNRYNRLNGSLHPGLIADMALYKFINALTEEKKELWFSKYSALEEEYGYYAEYKKGTSGNDPTGANIGVAHDCVVRNNIVVNERRYPNDKTSAENRNAVFKEPNGKGGLCYEEELSTGNIFVAEYDTSSAEAMKAGANLPSPETNISIAYPKDGSIIKNGPVRLVWRADGSQKEFEVTVTNAETDEVVFQGTTIENFVDTVFGAGQYNLTLEAKYQDSNYTESTAVSFECQGSELFEIASLDLSGNKSLHSIYDSGKISVAAYDYSGNRKDITDQSGITYTSSDTKVVTIKDDGSYSVKGKGSAVVTVHAGDAEASMVMYATTSTTTSYVYNTLTVDNYESYNSKYKEFTEVELIDDPTGNGKALKETAKLDANGTRMDISPVSNPLDKKTFVAGMWVYDNLSNNMRFGVKSNADNYPKTPHVIYYGIENASDTEYHLSHHHDDPESIPVEMRVARKEGWHQVFMAVEYDETNDRSYVEFYFDGKLVVKMVNMCYVTPYGMTQTVAPPIKERFVAINEQSAFTFVSTSVDNGEEVLPSGEIVLNFNKNINSEKTRVTEAYYMASDRSRVDLDMQYEENRVTLKPGKALTPGESYTLVIDATFRNVATVLVSETTARVNTTKSFKVRDNIKILDAEGVYTTADGKTTLDVSVKSLLEKGTQSVLLVMATKNSSGVPIDYSMHVLTLNPLEVLTQSISADEGSILEAYVWDKTSVMIPLAEKITNGNN